MTIADLRKRGLIILEAISGSKAYGLDTAQSDTDIKGVFILPKAEYYGLNYIPQINDKKNDTVFYELGRYMELLSLNNPNILELLCTEESKIIYKHPFLSEIKLEQIVSKLCRNTFGKYAMSQIKKSKGLNKKMLNPMSKERKNILSFCSVQMDRKAIPLTRYLELKYWNQADCGLKKYNSLQDVYGLYHSDQGELNGILSAENSNEVGLSQIEKNHKEECLLFFNRSGYSTYCKDYKEYWKWVENRNEVRFETNREHGKEYDAKNIMHVLRLLEMGIEIANEKLVKVKRPNREFLLKVKSGAFEYNEVLHMIERKGSELEIAFAKSTLMEKPDLSQINEMTYKIRDLFYSEGNEFLK